MRYKFGMANEFLDYSNSVADLYQRRGIQYNPDVQTRIAQSASDSEKRLKLSEIQDDYVYVAVRALTADVPNNNGDLFRLAELERIDDYTKQPVYKSFVNKGVYTNHQSDKVENSIGYIIDAELIKDASDPHVQIIIAIDSKKAPDIARGISTGRLRNFSMGCSIKYSTCTICGRKVESDKDFCDHLKKFRGMKYGKDIVAEELHGVQFIEISSVSVPADPKAQYLYRVASDQNNSQQVLTEYKKGDEVFVRTPRGMIRAEIVGAGESGTYTVKFIEGTNAYVDELDKKIDFDHVMNKTTENTRFHSQKFNERFSDGNIPRFCEFCGEDMSIVTAAKKSKVDPKASVLARNTQHLETMAINHISGQISHVVAQKSNKTAQQIADEINNWFSTRVRVNYDGTEIQEKLAEKFPDLAPFFNIPPREVTATLGDQTKIKRAAEPRPLTLADLEKGLEISEDGSLRIKE